MLICFCGAGNPKEETLSVIVGKEGASRLLALPSENFHIILEKIFGETRISYEVYRISSWKKRAAAAVDILSRDNGKMVMFPESGITLNTQEEYIAYLCKSKSVPLEII